MRPSIYPLLSRNFRIRLVTTLGLFGCLALTQVAIGQSTIAQQDFDGGTPEWEYSSNVPFFDNGWGSDGKFDVVPNSEWGGSSPDLNYSNLSGKILGINDLDDTDGSTSNGTKETAKVTFEKVNISGYKNVDVTFDYDLDGSGSSKWNNDFLKYQVFEDGVGQGVVTIANDTTKEGTETVSISSDTTDNFKLAFRIKQNSASDYGGIDNIELEGNTKSQSEPANQPSRFSANALSNGKIELTWSDASNTPEPDGYLIKATDQSASISAPKDNTDPSIDKDLSDGSAVVKVGDGTGGSYTFDGLNRNTKYDFQIWSFTNAEGNIDFLTSTAPSSSATTSENENLLTESFESTSGYTYPNNNGGSGNDFFDRTDIIDYPPTTDHIYSGFDQSYFIAGEDIDGVSSTTSGEVGQVKISNIDITGYQNLKVKGLLAAGANSDYDNTDGIEVEVKVDKGSWTKIADFKGNNGKLQEDTNLDGTANGTILDGSFEDFVWDVSQTGAQMSVRITMVFNANGEEAAFDNIRVSGKAPKKWNGGTSGDWSTGGNWEPSGVPESDDIVVLDDSYEGSDYTVNVDANLSTTSDTSIKSLKILPASGQSIDVVRKSIGKAFQLTGAGKVLTIEDGGTFKDKSSVGLPDNFTSGNGTLVIKSGGTYYVQNSSSFSTSSLVGQISSSSSSVGEVIIESAGQSISASDKTYPTALTLKNNTGSAITYSTSGGSAFTIEGDFTIGNNVTYKGDPNASTPRSGDLVVKGDFTNNGTFNLNNSDNQTLKLNGGSQQTLESNSDISGLTVDNSNGVELQNTLAITGTLTLTDGIVSFSNSSDNLVFESGASVSGGSASSYVAGSVKKKGSSDFKFPVGKSAQYAPIEVTNFSNSSDFTAEYFKSQSNNFVSSSNLQSSSLNNISQNEYWTLDRNNPSGSAAEPEVTLYWKSGMSHGISNLSDLTVARLNSNNNTSSWVDEGNSNTTGNTNEGSVTSNTITSFSEFTFGSTSSNDNALPVELLYFKAAADQGHANLTWATASETNNRHFQVQKQVGEAWENIGTIKGHGTTIEKQTYNFQDPDVKAGQTYYYRLKQVDFDGSYAYSDVKAVTLDGRASSAISIHPNPVSAQLHLTVNTKTSRNMEVVIQNIYGQQVYQGAMTTQAAANEQTLPVSQLSPGQYVIQLRGDERVVQKQFVKQ